MSDIDTVLVDSLKALDPDRPIREASEMERRDEGRDVPMGDEARQQTAQTERPPRGGRSEIRSSFLIR